MEVHIITVGDEILIGQIVDTNSAWMGQELNKYGIRISGITSVGDELEDIIAALHFAFQKASAVLMTGGLGPTKDDVTKKAIAAFYHVGFSFSQETYDRILQMFQRWGRPSTEAHRLQCFLPENATLLVNKMGTAPGMWFDEQEKVLVSVPGVPYEMKYLMEHEVIPKLIQRFPTQSILHRTIHTIGEGESRIAERISDFEDNLPPHLKLAYLPNLGRVRLRLTGKGNNIELLDQELDEKVQALLPLIQDLVFGFGDTNIETEIGNLLKNKGLTLATAESCTGGYIAHLITSISGSSAYFMGSVVAYANEVKMQQLGVQATTLAQHGAVSEATVIEMVQGLLKRLPADVGIAVSGIAGPTGGTPEKPVGTIWMAVAFKNGEYRTQKLQLSKDRLRNIEYTAIQAFNLIRQFVVPF